jgi:cobalt-zinc-cadmium resistance protein CzcA
LFQRLDSIYTAISDASAVKQRAGDAAGIDRIAAEAKMKETRALVDQQANEIAMEQQQLMMLLGRPFPALPLQTSLSRITLSLSDSSLHPELLLQQQKVNIADANISVQQNQNKPEFSGRFFSQRLYGISDPYTGFSVTAAFPLFGTGAARSKVRSAQAEFQVQEKTLAYQTQQFAGAKQKAIADIAKNNTMLNYYQSTGLSQADEIIKAATLSYRSGEISFVTLSQYLAQAIDIRKSYLENLDQYNHSAIQYLYYLNQ